MAKKVISQRKFIKGLNAGSGILSQPPGTVVRISNLCFTQRGSLQTIPGTAVVGQIPTQNSIAFALGVFANYTPNTIYPFYPAIVGSNQPVYPDIDTSAMLLSPILGSANSAGTYTFAVVASNSGGTTHSNYFPSVSSVAFRNPFRNGVSVTGWQVNPAAYYTLYYLPGGPSATQGVVIAGPTLGASTLSFSGLLPGSPLVTLPTPNNSLINSLDIGYLSPPDPEVLFVTTLVQIPALPTAPAVLSPGDPSFQFSSGTSPYGGVSGYMCPIPQILQFAQKAILILGNGYAPQSTNPPDLASSSLTALGNTFQATFPAWQASVAWQQGDQIAVLISAVNYVFVAEQSGVSGGSPPAFASTLGSTVADGQLFWKNTGPLTTSVAPRGAAHGIVYAGSLWLANTSPQTTTDNFDGPTVLKMSDSNNPNSWNPANVAFIGRDDGTQITGLATYTVAEVGIAPTGSLVVFKEFATFQIIGVFGATDFAITQAQTDLGCIAPRSIQFLPGYGICRFTHMGFAIFDGVKDRLISEEIRPYIFGGTGLNADITGIDFTFAYLSKGAELTAPPMYVCAMPLAGSSGNLTRIFCYDLVLKAWTIIDLPFPISTLTQARTGEGAPLLLSTRSDVITALGTGNLERLFAGDVNWESTSLVSGVTPINTPVAWTFSTTHVYQEGSSQRVFYRGVTVRGYASNANALLITATVTPDGYPSVTQQVYVFAQPGSAQFQAQIDLGFTTNIVNLTLSGQGAATIDSLDWEVVGKPVGATAVMAG